MIFEWDEEKYHANLMKHWVRFEDAVDTWNDQYSVEIFDSINSDSEDRYLRIGRSSLKGILTVVYCERSDGKICRIISARKASNKEKGIYERRV